MKFRGQNQLGEDLGGHMEKMAPPLECGGWWSLLIPTGGVKGGESELAG